MPQHCPCRHRHGPHYVPPRGSRTGFTCAGQPSADEFERQLTEAFGPE